MSDTVMTIEDFAAHLPELVEQIHARGDAAVIVRAGRPVVRNSYHPSDGRRSGRPGRIFASLAERVSSTPMGNSRTTLKQAAEPSKDHAIRGTDFGLLRFGRV